MFNYFVRGVNQELETTLFFLGMKLQVILFICLASDRPAMQLRREKCHTQKISER